MIILEAQREFEAICHAMADPSFYPHEVTHLQRLDTHISTVFLTGQWVYKLKKPVDFGFLDFTESDSRRHFCEREVCLNQRLSQGVYIEVVQICRNREGGYLIGGGGETVEHAVKMRQLREEDSLRWRIGAGNVSENDMRELGRRLADFYENSMRDPEIDQYGHPDLIAFNMEENFYQIRPFVDDLVASEEYDFIRQVSRAFFVNYSGLFEKRIDSGRIRDGHGDLRCDHVYFSQGIQIIDCVEFNDRFRYGDVVSDLAFLHMDLEHLGGEDLCKAFLAAYAERADDFEMYALLDFYACYRAVVKVKVACLRSAELESAEEREILKGEARSYLQGAYRYALQFSRPTVWVMMGLPATGKSSVAQVISERLSLPLLQSDLIRKEMTGRPRDHAEIVPYGHGAYQSTLRQRVYAKMLSLAQEELKQGHSVVLDATFSQRRWRDEVRQLAGDLDTNLIIMECSCDEETIRKRLSDRENELIISDARLQHLSHMIADYEKPTEIPAEQFFQVETSLPFSAMIAGVFSEGYMKKRAQVKGLGLTGSGEL